MAENEPNPQLKDLIKTVLKKVDGLATDVRSNSYKLDGLESKVDRIESGLNSLTSDVKVLTAQFNAVGVLAIDDNKRIDEVEKRVEVLEGGVH